MVLIDTHVAVFLYERRKSRLSDKAVQLINHHDVYLPQMAWLELHYLHEIGRVSVTPKQITEYLFKAIGLRATQTSMTKVFLYASEFTWTRDPFDRIISADAAANDCPLITKDTHILEHFDLAVW